MISGGEHPDIFNYNLGGNAQLDTHISKLTREVTSIDSSLKQQRNQQLKLEKKVLENKREIAILEGQIESLNMSIDDKENSKQDINKKQTELDG